MAKPILVVRIDQMLLKDDQKDRLKEALKNIEADYHIVYLSTGSIPEGVSFEIHGIPPVYNSPYEFGNLVTKVSGSDLKIILDRNPNRKRGEDPDKDNIGV